MQTEQLTSCDNKLPRLEYYAPAGEAPDCSPIRSFPFTIGRVEPADLTVNSKRVSREHAVIESHEGRLRIRDLQSTNGTFLNGEPVDEAWLTDGDILTIADTEFTFLSGEEQSASVATQVMNESHGPESKPRPVRELIVGVRRMHELSVHRAINVGLRPIVNLNDEQIVGWSAYSSIDEPNTALDDGIVLESSSYLASSLRQIARVKSLKEFSKRQLTDRLLVRVNPVELEDIATLTSHLGRLADEVPEAITLVAILPGKAAHQVQNTEELPAVLEEAGMGLAFVSTVADSRQLLDFAGLKPSNVVMTAKSFREMSQRRASRRQLTAVLAAFLEMGCQPIADGITDDDDDWHVLSDLGFELAYRMKNIEELAVPTIVEADENEKQETDPADRAQSTRAEIAEVTARIRASWSK